MEVAMQQVGHNIVFKFSCVCLEGFFIMYLLYMYVHFKEESERKMALKQYIGSLVFTQSGILISW